MNLPDAVNAIIAQLNDTSAQTHVTQLVEMKNELAGLVSISNEAAESVGLWDKVNIFSTSKEEQDRNEKRNAESELRAAVEKKEGELRTMIKKAMPPSVAIQCMLGELESELLRAGESTKEARKKWEESTKTVSEQFRRVRDYINSQNPVDGVHDDISKSLTLGSFGLKRLLASSAESCESAHATVERLIEYIGAPLSEDKLVQLTFESLEA